MIAQRQSPPAAAGAGCGEGDLGRSFGCEACGTRVVVVDLGDEQACLTCCARPMVPARPISCSWIYPHQSGGMVAGFAYTDRRSGLTVWCTCDGSGSVAVDGQPLVRQPKARQ